MQPKNDSNFSMLTVKMFTCFILQRSSTALPVRKVIEVTLFCNRQAKQEQNTSTEDPPDYFFCIKSVRT